MKKVLIVPVILTLAACNSAVGPTTVVKYTVVTPHKSMYDCPEFKDWPKHETLKDVEVAKTLVKLYKNNQRCRNSVQALERFLTTAKTTIEGTNDQVEAQPPTSLIDIFK